MKQRSNNLPNKHTHTQTSNTHPTQHLQHNVQLHLDGEPSVAVEGGGENVVKCLCDHHINVGAVDNAAAVAVAGSIDHTPVVDLGMPTVPLIDDQRSLQPKCSPMLNLARQ